MGKTPVIIILGIRCQPEVEKKFNKWYDQTHAPMLLECKALREIKHYKILKADEGYPNYLSIGVFDNQEALTTYINSPQRAAAIKEMEETWRGGGCEIVWRVQYEAIKTWRK